MKILNQIAFMAGAIVGALAVLPFILGRFGLLPGWCTPYFTSEFYDALGFAAVPILVLMAVSYRKEKP